MGTRRTDSETVLRSLVAISRRGLVDARFGDAPLSVTDQSIVMAIAEQPGIRSTDIARMFRLNRSTVSRQLAGLTALGIVCEADAGTGRGRPLELTPAGAAAYRGTLDALQDVIETHLTAWSDAEVARFAHDLDRFDRAGEEGTRPTRSTQKEEK
ncbi:DNA-binding MarR family transcriptional regulator [Microbacterium natoriense]|uniref:DNA-binding MarR family transcriptional regulator n=1 Tax=Microbacterium natoriense TaxID=284570 RepID=A0AAW8EX49_9MICO|nr:MarR family winged helix-turn-helix transcriptional regulator [Microbacterium natoriense]MDQ0648088.1 DNA-binding MarR family transcriptional regulator [Microbacterium natoriense]